MHIHILGISGTFMSALAILAVEQGHKVSGSDKDCYPPISTLLAHQNIKMTLGYEDARDALQADMVLVGNAIKRGMPVIEAVLAEGKKYCSGPAWLFEHVLSQRRVIAVAGTHGKTTTTSMIAWILQDAGMHPGFLIGGIAPNFNTNACLGKGEWFVIEADEYDSAFFDKRPKFMHYRPEIAILNNLEFDHADIYPNLEAIETQFHYLLRTISPKGLVLKPKDDLALNRVIERGLYSRLETLSAEKTADWQAKVVDPSGQAFHLFYKGEKLAEINWSLIGQFNVENALAAAAACIHAGVAPERVAAGLSTFSPVKRRLELRYQQKGISVYDDFAHHPTAITKTIAALKASARHKRILVIMEFASYTMRTGVHADTIGLSLAAADKAYLLEPKDFSLGKQTALWTCTAAFFENTDGIIERVVGEVEEGDAVLVMSNRGFENIHLRLIACLEGT